MPQPEAYERRYDLEDYAVDNPAAPYNPAQHDEEFNAVKLNLDGLNGNIALIQRDDGRLANLSVHPNSLDSATRLLIGGYNIRGNWAAFEDYEIGDFVEEAAGGYICMVAHTSTVFATDLALGRWLSADVNMIALGNTSDTAQGDALVGVAVDGGAGQTLHAFLDGLFAHHQDTNYITGDDSPAGALVLYSQIITDTHDLVLAVGGAADIHLGQLAGGTGQLFIDMDIRVVDWLNGSRGHGLRIMQFDNSPVMEFPFSGGIIELPGVLRGGNGADDDLVLRNGGASGELVFLNDAGSPVFTVTNAGIVSAAQLNVSGTKVVGARRTGWTAQTAVAARTDLGASPTNGQLASAFRALYDDLAAHGLIGT